MDRATCAVVKVARAGLSHEAMAQDAEAASAAAPANGAKREAIRTSWLARENILGEARGPTGWDGMAIGTLVLSLARFARTSNSRPPQVVAGKCR